MLVQVFERRVDGSLQRSDRPEEALTTLRKTLGSEFDTWSSGLQIRLDGGKLIELSFASADANDAQSRNKALVQKLTGAEDFGLVQLSRTQQPIPPIYSVAIGWGIAGGLVLGSTAALMRRSARAAA